jgi:hypothetical protein
LSLHAVRATGAQHLGRRNSSNDILSAITPQIKQLGAAMMLQLRTLRSMWRWLAAAHQAQVVIAGEKRGLMTSSARLRARACTHKMRAGYFRYYPGSGH